MDYDASPRRLVLGHLRPLLLVNTKFMKSRDQLWEEEEEEEDPRFICIVWEEKVIHFEWRHA